MPGSYDLQIVQGATFTRYFTWRVDGAVMSFDGFNLRSQIRREEDPESALILDLAPYMTVVDYMPTSGPTVANARIQLRIPADVTAGMVARDFKRGAAWDLFVISASDATEASCILEGKCTLNPSATRSL